MTTHWDYPEERLVLPTGARPNVPPAADIARLDAVREVLAQQVTGLLAQRAELIGEVETMRARLGAGRECARQGVRLVEHITVTQSTDGQWSKITALYEMYDELHDGSVIPPAVEEAAITAQARRRAARLVQS